MDTPRQPKAFINAKQVAKLAGVSRSAVSRAFTPGANISEDKRRRIVDAANQLGYHVNHLARGLLGRESGIVCLAVAESDAPYLSHLLRTLIERIQESGRVAMVISTSGPEEHVEEALRQTLNYRADAMVVLSGTPSQSIIRTCLNNGQRLILINRDDHLIGTHNIAIDNAFAAQTILHAFLRAGCKRLAVVTSEAGTPSLVSRETTFCRLASESGAQVSVFREGRTGYGCGVMGARALLAGVDRPEAVFCVTDLIACGFMDVARHEFHLQIPLELCISGFDNIAQADWGSYQLTTFVPPLDELADRVIELVSLPDAALQEAADVVLKPTLVWRSSVRRPA